MEFIDTHSHINFKNFSNDADQVILDALAHNTSMVLVGINYKTSRKAIDLANKYEKGVYSAIGLHPTNLEEIVNKKEDGREVLIAAKEDFNYEAFLKLGQFEKVVAIGEIGLDYYRLEINDKLDGIKRRQKEVLLKQLELSLDLDLPVILHCRQAHDDLIEILSEFKSKNKDRIVKDRPWGVVHCFSGDENLAWKYLDLGLNISFTGIITFSKQWDELIRKMPSDRFMIETDSPYLTPEPYRGKRNVPAFVSFIAERIAIIRGVNVEEIAKVTTNNANKFFNLV